MEGSIRTQVGIVGAGPAGLVLAHLLHLRGVESVVLETRTREYVERRVRAGVLEAPTVELLAEAGVGDRMAAEGLGHDGITLHFEGTDHHVDFTGLTGRGITVYGQQEVVKDLIAARLAAGQPLLFEVDKVELAGLDTDRPAVRFQHDGREQVLECDFVAGCDGFHGVSRPSVPAGVLTVREKVYPFAWLGILAQAPPAGPELIYARHEDGFALHSMRSPVISRNYLQVTPDEEVAAWPDDRIWAELRTRLGGPDTPELVEGPILEKGITPMRSFVVEPMRFGRLFLVGDAAHIVPPTGAKGMNLAVADAVVLARAIAVHARDGRTDLLAAYTATCLRRVWRAEHFSWWMTTMLHRLPGADAFDRRLQLAQLEYVTSSPAAATTLAENYVGLPFATPWNQP